MKSDRYANKSASPQTHNESEATRLLEKEGVFIFFRVQRKSKEAESFRSSKVLNADMEAGRSASELEGNLDLYSVLGFFLVFFHFFSSISLRSGLQHPVPLHSTNQHLTEEYIYKPSASGAIKHN